jgi:hypothetical protein|tara:strand:+ start:600 stop:1394 length:795 start_codon:yes stop_codon:yes gene_type:complete
MDGTNEVEVISPGIVEPVIAIEQAVSKWKSFEDLKHKLLSETDYLYTVSTNGKIAFMSTERAIAEKKAQELRGSVIPRVKKSGWRKLATPFNLSDEITSETPIGVDGKAIGWRIAVTVTAPNGRRTVGIGACTSNERYFGKREAHDVYSTAHTRAKNRAISDMIGGGDVSAEELEGMDYSNGQSKVAPAPKEEPQREGGKRSGGASDNQKKAITKMLLDERIPQEDRNEAKTIFSIETGDDVSSNADANTIIKMLNTARDRVAQ